MTAGIKTFYYWNKSGLNNTDKRIAICRQQLIHTSHQVIISTCVYIGGISSFFNVFSYMLR